MNPSLGTTCHVTYVSVVPLCSTVTVSLGVPSVVHVQICTTSYFVPVFAIHCAVNVVPLNGILSNHDHSTNVYHVFVGLGVLSFNASYVISVEATGVPPFEL